MSTEFSQPFNSPFETGIRSMLILHAAAPRRFDLEWLTALDHLVVHTGDIGGPKSLHPPVQARWAELVVRRGLVQEGLQLMMLKGLVTFHEQFSGQFYTVGDEADSFIDHMKSDYGVALYNSAKWLADLTSEFQREDLQGLTNRQFERWSVEFQSRPSEGGQSQ